MAQLPSNPRPIRRRMRSSRALAAATVLLLPNTLGSAAPRARAESPVLAAMRGELARSMASLKGQPTLPYFLSYRITDKRSAVVEGAFGTITASDEHRYRVLQVEARV